MPHVIGPDSTFLKEIINRSIEPLAEITETAMIHPDCVNVSELTYEGAIREYAKAAGCGLQIDTRPMNLLYSRHGNETFIITATVVRSGEKVDITSPFQLLEDDDVLVLEHLYC